MAPVGFEDKVAFVWKVADKLRGTFKQHEYGSVMLPLLVLRRMDAVLAPTREQVRAEAAKHDQINEGVDALLKRASGHTFYNTSRFTFSSMLSDDKNVAANLRDYITKLSPAAYRIIEAYDFDGRLERMDRAGILYAVLADFADLDLRPSVVSNEAMGYIFEELLRKFSEMSNETAGEHYTPREVIQLIVDLLVAGRAARELTENPAPVRTVYDPAAGTGGMLMTAMARIKDLNDHAIVNVFGQELNDETWAIAQSDLMMQGIDPGPDAQRQHPDPGRVRHREVRLHPRQPAVRRGLEGLRRPDQGRARRPRVRRTVRRRPAAGLRRVVPVPAAHAQPHEADRLPGRDRAVRLAAVLRAGRVRGVRDPPLDPGERLARGHRRPARTRCSTTPASPPTCGSSPTTRPPTTPGWSGSSTPARWAPRCASPSATSARSSPATPSPRSSTSSSAPAASSPTTPASRSSPARRSGSSGSPSNARCAAAGRSPPRPSPPSPSTPTPRSSGSGTTPRRPCSPRSPDLTPAQRKKFAKACAVPDPDAPVITGRGGTAEPDPDLRDNENVPLPAGWFDLDDDARDKALVEAAETHLETEIRPYVPDAWIDHTKTKVGVEIPFTRQFYVYEPPRPVEEIAAEIKDLETQIQTWMKDLGL